MLEEVFTNKQNVVNFIGFFVIVRNSYAARKGCQSKKKCSQYDQKCTKRCSQYMYMYTQNPLVVLGERRCLINTLFFCIKW